MLSSDQMNPFSNLFEAFKPSGKSKRPSHGVRILLQDFSGAKGRSLIWGFCTITVFAPWTFYGVVHIPHKGPSIEVLFVT